MGPSESGFTPQSAVEAPKSDRAGEIRGVIPQLRQEVKKQMADKHGVNSPDYKPYHGGTTSEVENVQEQGHVSDVARRGVLVMEVLYDSAPEKELGDREEDLALIEILGDGHDEEQNGKFVFVLPENKTSDFKGTRDQIKDNVSLVPIKRQRATGQNEKDTILTQKARWEAINEQRDKQGLPALFQQTDFDKLEEAYLATIPGFNPAKMEVIQPNLSKDAKFKYTTYALAWADLKGCFIDPPQQFMLEGDLNLMEDFPDIFEVVMNPSNFGPEIIEKMGERIKGWRNGQVQFVETQWSQIQEQMSVFSIDQQQALKERIFKEENHQTTLELVKRRALESQSQTPEQLLHGLRLVIEREQRRNPPIPISQPQAVAV